MKKMFDMTHNSQTFMRMVVGRKYKIDGKTYILVAKHIDGRRCYAEMRSV